MRNYETPNALICLLAEDDIISTSPLKVHEGTGDNASEGEDSVTW